MRRSDEALAKALGERAEGYLSLSNEETCKRKYFARKSEFYQKIMNDGYVFNPYIHRRWLPAQYSRIKNKVSLDYLRDILHIDYIYYLIVDEINKLYTLSKYDKEAYYERKSFFTIDVCKEVLLAYYEGLKNSLTTSLYNVGGQREFDYFVFPSSMTTVTTMKLLRGLDGKIYSKQETEKTDEIICKEINKQVDSIKEADTYAELRFIIKKSIFNGKKIRYTSYPRTEVPTCFYEAFWKSGAYYSIKHKIMFEHRTLNEKSGIEGCTFLRELLDEGVDPKKLHDIYMEME